MFVYVRLIEDANTWGLEAPPSVPGAVAHLHLKGHTQKWPVFAHPQKVTNLTFYKIFFY